MIPRAAWRGGVNGVLFLACVGVILIISSAFNGDVGFLGLGTLIFAIVGAAVAFVIGLAVGLVFACVDLALVTATRAILNEQESRP
jgi:membrane-bound ClpP family serine protease